MERLIIATMALALSACGAATSTPPASAGATPVPVERVDTPIVRADAAITKAEAAYARIRGAVGLTLPFLPDEVAGPVIRARAIADRALGTLRTAVTVGQRRAAIDELEDAVRELLAVAR